MAVCHALTSQAALGLEVRFSVRFDALLPGQTGPSLSSWQLALLHNRANNWVLGVELCLPVPQAVKLHCAQALQVVGAVLHISADQRKGAGHLMASKRVNAWARTHDRKGVTCLDTHMHTHMVEKGTAR